MSYHPQNPSQGNPYQGAGFRPRQSNAMGITGLIVSILGLLTCGLLSPVGLLFSLIGLARRPRGEAVAGTIIGGLGTLAVVAVIGFFVLSGVAITEAARFAEANSKTQAAFAAAESEIEQFRFDNGSLPGGIEGNKLVLQYDDGWETGLRYEPDGNNYRIRSAGPDQEFDTGDDLLARNVIDESSAAATDEQEAVPGEIELD